MLDFGVHHVHPHAATGNLGDFIRRTETGMENKLNHILVAELGAGGHQAALYGFFPYALQVDAAAIIGETQKHVATFAAKTEHNAAHF